MRYIRRGEHSSPENRSAFNRKVHLILVIQSGRTQFAPTISRIIKQFKGKITKQVGFCIWQKSFYDHVIRDEKDYLRIWEYIENNPDKWTEDKYFI